MDLARATESDPRVLVLAPQPFYQDRGTPIAVRHVIQALSEMGYALDVLTFPLGSDVDLPRVRIHRTPNPLRFRFIPAGFSWRKLVLNPLLALLTWQALRSRRYALIHAVEESVFYALPLGRLYGVPVIYDMQSSLPEQLSRQKRVFRVPPVHAALRWLERQVITRADYVICSAGLRAYAKSVCPRARVCEWFFPSELLAVPEATRDAVRAGLDIAGDAPMVLYVGTFAWYQGLDLLLGAVPAVTERIPRAVFVMVGARDEAEAESMHRRVPAEHRGSVRVLARQPRARMPGFLAAADLLVSPRSQGANLPLKIFDYLKAEKPIVATDIPAHRTILDRSRAMLVAPESASLARGIAEVLGDAEVARGLCGAAREYSLRELGWPGFVASVRKVLGDLGGMPT